MNNLDDLGFDPKLFRLGVLCHQNHKWRNSEHSLRYINGGNCIDCAHNRAKAHTRKQADAQKQASSNNLVGRQGSVSHRLLIDIIRCKALALLDQRGYKDVVCLTTALAKFLLGGTTENLAADIIFIDKETKHPILIEVGKCQPCKWSTDISVIHVGFNRRVSKINFQGHHFETELYDVISSLIQGRKLERYAFYPSDLSDGFEAKIADIRDDAILSLLTSGVSIAEIAWLKRSDYAADKGELRLELDTSEESVFWLSSNTARRINSWQKVLVSASLESNHDFMFVSLDRGHQSNRLSSNSIRVMAGSKLQEFCLRKEPLSPARLPTSTEGMLESRFV